jgi:hypothetical protein
LEYLLFTGLGLLIVDVALIAIMRARGVFQEQASLDSVAFNALGLDQYLEVHRDDAYIRSELICAGISRVNARDLETAIAVENSGPLSYLIRAGTPRKMNRSVRTSMTSSS